ncbi:hypothetical protein [Microbispora bryophytorum]|uniref:hypothetical protein n=1 Tax=Microbispora bryophytorum TaxID=1460882 RepID=UPI0033EE6274
MTSPVVRASTSWCSSHTTGTRAAGTTTSGRVIVYSSQSSSVCTHPASASTS